MRAHSLGSTDPAQCENGAPGGAERQEKVAISVEC